MSVDYNFLLRDKYLRVEACGDIRDHEEMTAHARQIVDASQKLNRSRVLIHSDGLNLRLAPMDIVAFAEIMDELELCIQGLRLAVVAPSQPPESRNFIETTMVNRSVRYKVFQSEEAALAWLAG